MGIFDFLKSLFGGGSTDKPRDDASAGIDFSAESGQASPYRPGQSPPILQPAGGSPAPQNLTLGGLDTDKFAPLAEGDALAATDSADWKSAYYDSLHVIPSEDLPRIRVIDRTMVGYGLISAEELAEIHDVGRRMEVFQDRGSCLRDVGQQAVDRSRSEANRIKEQKKREAEAKRDEHRKAVARRRATDIVFLGRGVSKGLADRRSNIEKLEANHLPVLSTPAELAEAMGLPISQLRWLAFHNESPTRIHYVMFQTKKKSGGVRRLAAPHRKIANAQRWVLENVLEKLPHHDAAHGFVKQRSTVTNAQPHVNSEVILNLDLRDFFPSISFYRAEGLFRSFGYSPAVATIMALICTECPREIVRFSGQVFYPAIGPRSLPQGACTSPAISNLISRGLDHRLQGIARRLEFRYTRYADDLTFSGSGDVKQRIGYLLARVRHIAKDEGFAVQESKTRVQRKHGRQTVTGLVVNDQLGVPRPLIRRIRAILHNAKRTGLAAQNRNNEPHFESWLRGMIAYIEMVNPTQGYKLRTAYETRM